MHTVPDLVGKCTVCQSPDLTRGLHFGLQPPSNRFITSLNRADEEETYPLSIGYCSNCGTTQLIDRMPLEAIRPRYDWLIYNEPEGHLDDVADVLAGLDGIRPTSRLLGITYKDQSLLTRLSERGMPICSVVDQGLLQIDADTFGLETIQHQLLQPEILRNLLAKYGSVDMVIARHIVEHAESAVGFIRSLSNLLSPGGYLVLELPDSERILAAANYPFIWEEHISYFTAASLARLAVEANANLVRLDRYPYPYEDSLVAILQFDRSMRTATSNSATENGAEAEKMHKEFEQKFAGCANAWRNKLETIRNDGKKIAFFGAGHLAVKFVNFFGVQDLIECVIDDHPKKVGMFMPGSRLPIVPSSQLQPLAISCCVSALSPESEIKVRAKLSSYFEDGGVFISAFDS